MSNPHFQAHKHAANTENTADTPQVKMADKVLGTPPVSVNTSVSRVSSTFTASTPTAEASVPEVTPWSQLADLHRQQLAWLSECASALLRGVESIRKTQQEAARLASDHHAATAKKLRDPEQPDHWLELMSAPLCVDMEGCGKYWSQMASTSVQTHSEIIQSIYQAFDSEKSPTVSSMQKIW